jgi:hypothetical protein
MYVWLHVIWVVTKLNKLNKHSLIIWKTVAFITSFILTWGADFDVVSTV